MTATVTLSSVDLLLRVSAATVGAGELPVGTNAGPYVERVLKRTGLGKGFPWCAAQIADWGVSALGEDWPVERTASCVQLAAWARAKRCLFPVTLEGDGTPLPGDIYLQYHAKRGRFAHTGLIVAHEGDWRVRVRDGNTTSANGGDPERQREGWGVVEKTRTLTARDALIRWTLALA